MNNQTAETQWESYREYELRTVLPVLANLGYILDSSQVHTAGERFLMVGERDVGGGGYKLVLLGTRVQDGQRVVIKVSSTPRGKAEIETERIARETVRQLKFSYQSISVPDELVYTEIGAHTVFITKYIPQDQTFLSRSILSQFLLALDALKSQESFHATTSSHARAIQRFGTWGASDYLASFDGFTKRSMLHDPDNNVLGSVLQRASEVLLSGKARIDQYGNFLTHADFVPHNFRIRDGVLYLLDSASLHFGNKYESWARLANFMLLYNRPLEHALNQYVLDNRAAEENESFRLMRIYKVGTLLEYHTNALSQTSGDLNTLSRNRVTFWLSVMQSLLDCTNLSEEVVATYKESRDKLRSEEEKKRQESLH